MSGYVSLEKLEAEILKIKDTQEWHRQSFESVSHKITQLTEQYAFQRTLSINNKIMILDNIFQRHRQAFVRATQELEKITQEYTDLIREADNYAIN